MMRFDAKTAGAAALSFAFFIAACSLPGVSIAPAATPTQTLTIAEHYISGFSEIPPGKILLVLARSDNSGSGSCDFPVVEQTPLAFRFDGALKISSDGSLGWISDENLMDVRGQEIKGLGFFGYTQSNDYTVGGGVHDEIYYIDQLPFTVAAMSFVIHSALKDGTIIASVNGDVFEFRPNQAWVGYSSQKYESNPDCLLSNRFSITNHGLLDIEDVKFIGEPILP